jgi:LmbE family N-acetylglucosaminyl deacetylase
MRCKANGERAHPRGKLSQMSSATVKTPRAASRRFDAATLGFPEDVWAPIVARLPEWTPKKGSLLVVSPHPDDETLGAGGLMHAAIAVGAPVRILSVTRGEAAYSAWPGLAAQRDRELQNSLGLLGGGRIEVRRLGLPDGRVRHHESELGDAIRRAATPTTTLIAPYEFDGHPDHESVAQVCLDVAAEKRLAIARYPIWAWHHAGPRLLQNGRWVRFNLTPRTQQQKADAIRCFESQLAAPARAPILPAHVLPYFHRRHEVFLL